MSFTAQLSFSKHLESVIVKAQSKIGMVYSKFKNLQLKLPLLLKIFECYILPSFTYGISVWFERTSLNTITKANALFSKYLKRYLGVPAFANNSITYFICQTEPLEVKMKKIFEKATINIDTQIKDIVPNTLSQGKTLKDHIKSVHEQETPFKCNQCDYISSQKKDLKEHIKSVHGQEKHIKCNQCDYTTSQKKELKEHINSVHELEKHIKCNQCDDTASHKTNLENHTKSFHEQKQLSIKCSSCWFLYNVSKIPTYFWRSKIFKEMPQSMKQRRDLCKDIMDKTHYKSCK